MPTYDMRSSALEDFAAALNFVRNAYSPAQPTGYPTYGNGYGYSPYDRYTPNSYFGAPTTGGFSPTMNGQVSGYPVQGGTTPRLSFQVGDMQISITPSRPAPAAPFTPPGGGMGLGQPPVARFSIPGVGDVEISSPRAQGGPGVGGYGTTGAVSPSPYVNSLLQNPYGMGAGGYGGPTGAGTTNPYVNSLLQNLYGGSGAGTGVGGYAGYGGAGSGGAGFTNPLLQNVMGGGGFGGALGMGGPSGLGFTADTRPAMSANGDDDGFVSGIGFNNAVLDDVFGTDYDGTIGGGNAARATNNGIVEGGLLGGWRATNDERTDFDALSNMISTSGDPLADRMFRSFRQEGGRNVYTGYLDGTPDAVRDVTENGRINGAELANQGNNSSGQKHWSQYVGGMMAGVEGTTLQNHNTALGQTVERPEGGFRTFFVHANGGDHNGAIVGYVDDPYATSAENARERIEINNTTRSASDIGQDGTVQAGAVSGQAFMRNRSRIPGLGTAAPDDDGGSGHGGGGH